MQHAAGCILHIFTQKSNHKIENCYKKQNDNDNNDKGNWQNNKQNVVEKTKPLEFKLKELNYSNGIYNTPPDDVTFATAFININDIQIEAMFD